MSYNNINFQAYINTAGKITIITALFSVVAFTLIFLLNIGAKEFKQAVAQGVATTSITVLNTPPAFSAGPFEFPESSTSSPTNSGDNITWAATAIDPSGDDYYLLVCDAETASPTANSGAVPTCDGADTTWGVSAIASSGVQATVATTTQEAFAESNTWVAWVCDSVAINPRCNKYAQSGTGSTSSPFNVNHRPTFSGYWNDSPADPGTSVIFYATSTDSDTDAAQDTLQLIVCSTNSFNTVTDTCDAVTLATSSLTHPNPTATYTIPSPFQDDDYDAYGFIIDQHGHESVDVAQGTGAAALTVSNVAPQVLGGTIVLNGGQDMLLTEGIETTGFTLDFVVTDNNSCDAVGGGLGDEFSTSTVSVFRSGIGSSTCDGSAGAYNANNCYTSESGPTVWNLQCTASTTTCGGSSDSSMTVECTFPLWFIADPTDGATASDTLYFNEEWTAGVSATDDDAATGLFTQGTASNPDVLAVLALNLLTTAIPYGALEPGTDTGTLSTTTTAESTGNTGLDQELEGESMCNGYTSGSPCSPDPTSTIPESEQEFATSAIAYGSGTPLSSTTPAILDINIQKSTSTSTPNSKDTYWGIAVPASITFSGSYTGENTFTAVLSDPLQW